MYKRVETAKRPIKDQSKKVGYRKCRTIPQACFVCTGLKAYVTTISLAGTREMISSLR